MFLAKKYPNEDYKKYPNHYLFASYRSNSETINPHKIYLVMHRNFKNLLKKVNMDSIRSGVRRDINFHLLRTYCKTTVSNISNSDFSEYILGHAGSRYYEAPQKEINALYLRCEKYLTYLDYSVLEAVSKDTEAQLESMQKQMEGFRKEIASMKN